MFWSSDKIEEKQIELELIKPFESLSIHQGAYELRLGPQVSISRDGSNALQRLNPREMVLIPGGQFALLVTEETVHIPDDVIGFISLKTKVKSQGLVNVSGFHVDPGFHGRLKFWVYNAGNQDIRVLRGDRTFLIWFSDLDRPTRDPYPNRDAEEQNEITSEDLRRMQGRLSSPASLEKRITELGHRMDRFKWFINTMIGFLIAIFLLLLAPTCAQFIDFLNDRPLSSGLKNAYQAA